MAVTAKEQLQRRVEAMSEAEALDVLENLDTPLGGADALARLKTRLDGAPADDEPLSSEDEEAIAEALADVERRDVVPHKQIRRELLGS